MWLVRLSFASRLALWGVLLAGLAASAQDNSLPPEIYARVAQALVRIEAVCPSEEGDGATKRVSQGFVIGDAGEVVTARHGIVGCHHIRVQLFGGEEHHEVIHDSPARPTKLLKSADLALVQVEQMPPAQVGWPEPLERFAQEPPPATDIFVIARYFDAPSPTAMPMQVGQGARRLRNLVDPQTRQQLESAQSPSLELEIVNLRGGVIITGTSGAPLVNGDGQVVAIADGGLGDGMVQVNWAIPVGEIERLATSPETGASAQEGEIVGSLFAAEYEVQETERPPPIQCGDREFVLLRAVGLPELAAYADDPEGVVKLLQEATFDVSRIQFDVYQDLDSGAAIAVPAGAQLQSLERGCVAQIDEAGNILVLLMARTVSEQEDLAPVLNEYTELLATVTQNIPWTAVPQFSSEPKIREADGMSMTRLMFVRNIALQDELGQQHPIQETWFQAITGRGDTFVAYSAFVSRPEKSVLEEEWGCLRSEEANQACKEQIALEDLTFAAVELTTFPLQ